MRRPRTRANPIIDGMRVCLGCERNLPIEEFGPNRSNGKDYRQPRCRRCLAARRREWTAQNALRNRHEHWAYSLMRKYGITAEDYDRMFQEQGGRCAICRTDQTGHKAHYRMHVDHDHLTGKVRGLLCNQCNVGLSNFKDDPELLRIAIEYLTGVMVN